MSPTETITETVRNGVDTATLFATLDAIKAQPEIAKFRFRARNQWIGGAHNRIDDQGLLRRVRRGHHPRARPSRSTPASPRSCWAPTPGPTRPSTCCTRWPRASPPRWSTRRPPAACG